jgi:hypothetical protein
VSYPAKPDTERLCAAVPVELADWLRRLARPHGTDRVTPAGSTVSDHIAKALYVYRELLAGIPSPVSAELLDAALASLETS